MFISQPSPQRALRWSLFPEKVTAGQVPFALAVRAPLHATGNVRRTLPAPGQERGRTRLGEKAKKVSLVDRRDGRFHIGITRQKDPHRVRRGLPNQLQKGNTIHARHPQVGQEHSKRPMGDHQPDCLFGAACCCHVELAPQSASQAVKHSFTSRIRGSQRFRHFMPPPAWWVSLLP